jgi:hypothetical protein
LFCVANGAAVVAPALVSVANFGANPTNLQMSIYVPAKLATDPAIIVAVSNQPGWFYLVADVVLFRCTDV